MTGGHKFRCGHFKKCGDHVQTVKEAGSCAVCTLLDELEELTNDRGRFEEWARPHAIVKIRQFVTYAKQFGEF